MSSYLIKRNIPYPTIYSLTKTHTFLPAFTSIKLKEHPPDISLKTPSAHDFSAPQEFPRTPNVPDFDPVPPQEFPKTPNVPDFDPVPPEKPTDPTPGTPNPAPEFPGPPVPDPEFEPPAPDMPVPPNTPGGPELVPPARPPEWMPPSPPDVGPQYPAPPEIPLAYAALV